MNPSPLLLLWSEYLKRSVDTTIHPSDDMYNKNVDGWQAYADVGYSAAQVIFSSLSLAPVQSVTTILDFGCGHGRVSRHLRALFPDAEIYFTDIDTSCYSFCASQFKGRAFPSVEDFSALEIPDVDFDLIFLGSVFTHLDWVRSKILWEKLFDRLRQGGVLIGTFRGRTAYRLMMSDIPKFNHAGYYNQVIEDYKRTGFGYQDYRGFTNWGQNIFDIKKYAELSSHKDLARIVGITEAGWANIHDVVTWTRRSNWSQ